MTQIDNINNLFSIRISWDSWDWIQIIGNILSQEIAIAWNNISTIPDYPSEIRAPIGTIEWVSSYTISFWSANIIPPNNKVDILIVLNPAALKANMSFLKKDSLIIINSSTFTEDNLKKANYTSSPLEDWSLKEYIIIAIDMFAIIQESLSWIEISSGQKLKSKNFFVLWYLLAKLWYNLDYTEKWIKEKFVDKVELSEINSISLKEWVRYFREKSNDTIININKKPQKKWKYRILSWNEAIAYWLMSSTKISNKKLFYGSYPITPASEILHTLLKYRSEDIIVFQAEDEIAAIWWAIWASFAGSIWITGTSWPGLSLKTEMLNLAVMTELPLVLINVMRWWPSTGLPTKTEQWDLFQAMFGRNWDSPLVVMAVSNLQDCFEMSLEAVRIATKYMTPVIILSDAYIANSKESFRIPEINELPEIELNQNPALENFYPYSRNPETLGRPWTYPWMKWFEHRIGWLEKDYNTWKISYTWENHEKMTITRKEKISWIAREIPVTIINWDITWDLLVIGWWSTYNSITSATNEAQTKGLKVSSIHLKFINPLPSDLEEIFKWFDKILLPEENSWQLKYILESEFKRNIIPLNKIQWQTLYSEEILEKIRLILK